MNFGQAPAALPVLSSPDYHHSNLHAFAGQNQTRIIPNVPGHRICLNCDRYTPLLFWNRILEEFYRF